MLHIPPWHGLDPARGGGFDKDILKLIAAQKVGDTVSVTWKLEEHRRILAIKPAGEKKE